MREELADGKITIKKIIPLYVEMLFKVASESKKEVGIWMPWCHPSDHPVHQGLSPDTGP